MGSTPAWFQSAPNILLPISTMTARISDTFPSPWKELHREKRFVSRRKKYEGKREEFLEIYYNLHAASLAFALPHTHSCSNTQESPDEWPEHRDYMKLVGNQKPHCSTILPWYLNAAAMVKYLGRNKTWRKTLNKELLGKFRDPRGLLYTAKKLVKTQAMAFQIIWKTATASSPALLAQELMTCCITAVRIILGGGKKMKVP